MITEEAIKPATEPATESATELPYADRVRKGIELLDRLLPYWRGYVLPRELEMNDSKHCIIGQTLKRLDDIAALEAFKQGLSDVYAQVVPTFTQEAIWPYDAAYGFSIYAEDYAPLADCDTVLYHTAFDAEYRKLTDTWLALAFGQPPR